MVANRKKVASVRSFIIDVSVEMKTNGLIQRRTPLTNLRVIEKKY